LAAYDYHQMSGDQSSSDQSPGDQSSAVINSPVINVPVSKHPRTGSSIFRQFSYAMAVYVEEAIPYF